MPFFDAEDAAIYYEMEGQGRPLMLLHGYGLNGLMWKYQRPEFAKSHNVITIDLRGFGRSSSKNIWSDMVMAKDVMGIIKELKLKDIAILGFSMSGPVAIRIAYLMAKEVKKLILASSILPSRGVHKTIGEKKRDLLELEILKTRGVEGWARSIGMWNGPLLGNLLKGNPDLNALWGKIISTHDLNFLSQMMAGRSATEPDVDWRLRLKEIKQRTLIIAGALDSNFIAASKRMTHEIPKSELVIIEGAGHMLNLEKPNEFNSIVLGFLKNKKN